MVLHDYLCCMARYFLELGYHGANYAGFQIQENAHTVQEEVERALATYFRVSPLLTGSSRTDSGVHARQNFFHFDVEQAVDPRAIYNLNALLPADIVVRSLHRVHDGAHCRFDAISRSYIYTIYSVKDPFLRDRAYFYPYTLHLDRMADAAALLMEHRDFTSFSKRNTQVRTFNCEIVRSEWVRKGGNLEYHVEANRFLRGMVRGLVATMLRIGRGRMSVADLKGVLAVRDNSRAWFDVPGHGLMLNEVRYDWERLISGPVG